MYADFLPVGVTAMFQVPAGERWLITDVTLEAQGPASYIGLYQSGAAIFVTIVTYNPPPDTESVRMVDAFVVLNAGDIVTGLSLDYGCSVLISGHVFHVT